MKTILFLLSLLVLTQVSAQTLVTRNVATGFDTPWEILWGPDNHIWMTERIGKINRVNPETGTVQNLITIPEVFEGVERGLMGLALHPDFLNTPKVYAAYTYGTSTTTVRVVSFEYDGSALKNQQIIIDNITGNSTHDGCRLFISDNKLFITTGDAQQQDRPQNPNSLNGKLLRLNLDGSVPSDNPMPGNPVWSLGHRNAQGLVIVNGRIYSSEHGANSDDEVNLIVKNGNFGWPNVEGFCDDPGETAFCNANNVTEPMRAWTPTLAVAGIDYYNHSLIPQFANSLLMVSLKAGRFTQLALNAAGDSIIQEKTIYNNTFGRLRDLCIAPDGRVFIATSNRDGRGAPGPNDDRIIELKPSSSGLTSLSLEATVILPNPVDSGRQLHFHFPAKGTYETGIYDTQGRFLTGRKFVDVSEAELSIASLAAGTYLIKIKNGPTAVIKKLVVK